MGTGLIFMAIIESDVFDVLDKRSSSPRKEKNTTLNKQSADR
jgi:hypothetical protein